MEQEFDLHHITELIHSAKPEIRDRGFFYYTSHLVVYAEMDFRTRSAKFKVQGTAKKPYNVEIKNITTPAITVKCDCPYDKGLCKHGVAALFYLRDNFQKMLEDYNKRYYPTLPEKDIKLRGITEFMKVMKHSDLEEVVFGKMLHKYQHTKLRWFNPLLKILEVDVDNYTVRFPFYDNFPLIVDCTCGIRNCKHTYAACFFALDFKNSKTLTKILEFYKRKPGKPITIGKVAELEKYYVSENLPNYFPVDFKLVELKLNYIKLKLKVRYQYVYTEFIIKNNIVYSKCSCNDEVEGICKHQIAGLNLLLELQDRFFIYLTDKKYYKELADLFK